MFQIEFTPEALEDLRLLRAYDQRRVVEAVEAQHRHQPAQETRNRKRLRPKGVRAIKTVTIPEGSQEIRALLDQARDEDVIVRLSDGSEFMLSAVDDFDREIAHTRRNEKLMALLDERAGQTRTIPLEEVKRQLGFDG